MNHFRAYLQIVKPYRWLIAITLAIGIIKFAIPLTLPLFLKYVVDDVLLADLSVDDKTSKLFKAVGLAFLLFVVVRYPVEYYRQYFAQLTTSRVLFDLRNKLYAHLQRLSIRFYQNRKSGEIISRMMNDAEQTKSLVETGLMNVWLDMFTLVIALVIMFNMNVALTFVAIAILPFYGYAVKKLYKRLRGYSRSRSQAMAEMQGYLNEHVNGIPVVKSFTLESYEQQQFGNRNQTFLERAFALTRWNALTQSIINTLTEIAPLLVLACGGYFVVQGSLTLGEFVAFYGYLDRLYAPLRRLVNSSTELTQASASLERVMELLGEQAEITDAPDAVPLRAEQGDIHFRNVSFRYHNESDWVLRNINLHIPRGHTVALVGMSGGGKSSLVSLLARFYDTQEGEITINGQPIRGVTQHSLRSQIGMVLQDNILFSGSARENILLGNPNRTEEQIYDAARRANAHEFIMSLPKGYDTEIGERGVKLSGGQKQRIAIARVFLKDPAILVLDEATSALDLESEHAIQESLAELSQNRTTLVVAHRLSTITHADLIVVIEHGHIVEQGRHDELMRSGGAYARLYNVQYL
ncbi:ABC transporter ATP-binding protein [Paenibacillus lignilyticus]|uniref:ABC transporter ATP-binding protein n=1 Tax=Paenibacillus lignilyticus TaxID=1172615 RepID=A0ABS5CJ04_9BACL|nr:ABC transporter ATP-binding protein [Paenibacillus lignilyticus]MBP3965797.1 ABC transporter ATP-binding protein [Paenibacillus lignilyticus]